MATFKQAVAMSSQTIPMIIDQLRAKLVIKNNHCMRLSSVNDNDDTFWKNVNEKHELEAEIRIMERALTVCHKYDGISTEQKAA